MVSPSSFLVFLCGLALCSAQAGSGANDKPECADEASELSVCLTQNAPPPPMVKIEDLRADAQKCFKDTGCAPPTQNGPPPGAPPPPFSDTCFQNLHQKAYSQFERCMKEKDPTYGNNGTIHVAISDDPRAGVFAGVPPQFGGPGGLPPPGGPPPGGPPPGGPGGFGPPPGIVAQMCGNDKAKAEQLETCMKNAHDKNQPSKDEMQKHFDGLCKAKKTCKPKLSSKCEEVLQKRAQFVCQCHEQTKAKADEIFKQEPACSGKEKPRVPGPPAGGKVDCSKPHPDPCDEGFEKFYARLSQSGPPPGSQ